MFSIFEGRGEVVASEREGKEESEAEPAGMLFFIIDISSLCKMSCIFGFSCFNNIPFVYTGNQVRAGEEFVALPQEPSIEIGPGLVIVITMILQCKY